MIKSTNGSKHVGKVKSRASRDIMIYTTGTILRQLVGFIMLPIYTNYLTPADYGVISLLTLSVAIFELVMGARFAQAIPKFYYDESSDLSRQKVLSTALTVTLLFSMIGVVSIWIGKSTLSSILFGSQGYAFYVAVFGVLLLTSGIESYGLMYLRILERPIAFVSVSLIKLVIQLSLNIFLLIYMDLGIEAVVISAVVSSAIFGLYFLGIIYSRCGFHLDITLGKCLLAYTWPLWMAGGASLYISSSNRYFIRVYASLDDVGLFELATRFSMILTILVWQPFGNWWQTERFKILKEFSDPSNELQKVFNLVITVMAVFSVGIILFSAPVIQIMSAKEFHNASVAIAPLTIAVFFFHASLFFNLSFLVNSKTIVIAYIKYFSAALVTVLYVLLVPELGFFGAALAVLLTNICIFGLTYKFGKKQLDLGIKLAFFYTIVGLLLVFVAVEYWLASYIYSFISLLIMKAVLAALFITACGYLLSVNKYTGTVLLEKRKEIKQLLSGRT